MAEAMSDDHHTTGPQPGRHTTATRWRSRTSTKPLAVRANGNSVQGRRIRDLFRAYTNKIGAGDAAMADALVRIENLAHRSERRLGRFTVPAKSRTLAQTSQRGPASAPSINRAVCCSA
jgi:hypothetical protein